MENGSSIAEPRHIYPTEKQQIALDCPCDTIVFGGSRGGGKSACSYMKIMQHATLYGKDAHILFLRKTLKELEPNIDEAKRWYEGIAVWKEQKKRFEFKNGAICEFDYLEGDKIDSYQGHAYTLVVYDELGNFSSIREFDLMRGNMRSAKGIPCQIFATCNPGGTLHNIIKARFIDVAPPMTPVADGWDDSGKPLTWKVYIPSTLYENPYLLKNDPTYIQRLKQIGSPEMVRAWLLGDWNIISGGAFDKLFDRDIHVIKPFRVPQNWRIIEVYDDGTAKPYAVCWFAVSDGSDYTLPNGETRHTIRGDTFVIAELYGWNGTPNVGTGESVESKAIKIKAKEKALGYHISERIADSAIFSSKVHSIADDFEENGICFTPCNKKQGSRINSINIFRNRLIGSLERKESAGIFWFNTCLNSIRTIPTLPRDKKNPDDVDSLSEDHCLEENTIIHTLEYGDVPIKDLVGKTGHCMTAGGYYTPFYNCKCYFEDDELFELTLDDGRSVIATKDHKILTNNGYKELQEWKSLKSRKQNKVLTMKCSTSAGIISNTSENVYILQYGNTIMGKSQKGMLYTILMETSKTIKSKICNFFRQKAHTQRNTGNKAIWKTSSSHLNAEKPQNNGIILKEVKNGTKNIMKTLQKDFINLTHINVMCVEKSLSQKTQQRNTAVPITLNLQDLEAELTIYKSNALSAGLSLGLTNILLKRPVPNLVRKPCSVKSVKRFGRGKSYCLTTMGTHNIVVNDGIIVSNCLDTVLYFCLSEDKYKVSIGTISNSF